MTEQAFTPKLAETDEVSAEMANQENLAQDDLEAIRQLRDGFQRDQEAAGPGHRRPGPGHRGTADRPLQPGPLHPGRRARPGQDLDDQHAVQVPVAGLQPHPVHARPDALRHHRHRGHRGEPQHRPPRVQVPGRPAVRQRHPGRRDQPHAAQDPGRPAGSHAGTPGHRRPRPPPPGRPVLRAGHAEPDRAGRHLSAARGPARPLHVQGVREVPQLQRGVRDRPADDRPDHRGDPAGAQRRPDPGACSGWCGACR